MKFEYIYGEDAANDYPDIKLSIERITPELAKQWLDVNVDNRDKKRESLAYAMSNDEWMVNGETIVFSNDGVLRDGQNRLMGVIESGKTIVSIIVRGIDPDAQVTMDCGIKRQVSDFLKMRGYKEYKKVATIGMALLRADKFGLQSAFYKVGVGRQAITTKEALSYIEENYESRIAPIMSLSTRASSPFRCVRMGTMSPLIESFYRIDIDATYDFVEQLSGAKTQCQPIQMLANRLNKADKNKQVTITQGTVAALVVKVWNAYMQGENISTLKFTKGGAHPEEFPQIYGANGEI